MRIGNTARQRIAPPVPKANLVCPQLTSPSPSASTPEIRSECAPPGSGLPCRSQKRIAPPRPSSSPAASTPKTPRRPSQWPECASGAPPSSGLPCRSQKRIAPSPPQLTSLSRTASTPETPPECASGVPPGRGLPCWSQKRMTPLAPQLTNSSPNASIPSTQSGLPCRSHKRIAPSAPQLTASTPRADRPEPSVWTAASWRFAISRSEPSNVKARRPPARMHFWPCTTMRAVMRSHSLSVRVAVRSLIKNRCAGAD